MAIDIELDAAMAQGASDFAARTADIPDTLGTAPGQPGATPGDLTGQPTDATPGGGSLTPGAIRETLSQLSSMLANNIKGGQFWQLQKQECEALSNVWHPILSPLWDKWLAETNGYLLPALMLTAVTLLPRAMMEWERRKAIHLVPASSGSVSTMESKAMERHGDSQPSSDQPEVENLLKQTA